MSYESDTPDPYGHDPDSRSPRPNFDSDAISAENKRALKELDDGGELPWWSLMELVLIGASHPAEYYVTFTVSEGMHGGMSELQTHIAEISKKEVKWA